MSKEADGTPQVNSVDPEDIEVRDVERRSFLRVAAIGLVGLAAACGSESSASDDVDQDPTDEADSD